MDLEEWELLPSPKNSFKDLDHDEDHHVDMVMDYFRCPSAQEPLHKVESPPRSTTVHTKETEFADMKIDTPARITSPVSLNDAAEPSDPEGSDDVREKKEDDDDDDGGEKANLWKIGLNGIGAICTFGVAATVCALILGHNNVKVCKNKSQMLRFQIYSDDNKRMRETVNHATKVNETIFAMKGVPVVRAQISFGGYYDGL